MKSWPRVIGENALFVSCLLLSISLLLFSLAFYSHKQQSFAQTIEGELKRKATLTALGFLSSLEFSENNETLQKKIEEFARIAPEIEIVFVAIPEGNKFRVIASSAPEKINLLTKTELMEKVWQEGETASVLERRQIGKRLVRLEPITKAFSIRTERILEAVFPILVDSQKKGLLLLRFSFADIDTPLTLNINREKRNLVLLSFLFYPILLFFGFWANKKTKKAGVLKDVSRAKDELLSFAAHELNAPLTYIKGSISVVLEEKENKLTTRSKELFDQAMVSVEQLIALVEDFLTVSRFEQGKVEIFPRPFYLEELYKAAVSRFKESAEVKDLQLEYIPPKKPLPKLVADPDKINQVLVNLLSNSIKYTEKGGITISGELRGKEVVTQVTNTGVVIPKKEVEKLFQRFVRLKTAGKVKGTGLGLYISRLIIEAHKGRIWAESRPGKGNILSFSLPIPRKEVK